MIDYLISIGTRKGKRTLLSHADVRRALANGKAWVSFTCPVCQPDYRQNARCRIDGTLYQCFSLGCDAADPRGITLATLKTLLGE